MLTKDENHRAILPPSFDVPDPATDAGMGHLGKWLEENWLMLACFVAAGLVYYAGHHWIPWPEFAGHLAAALFVAGVLGIIIEGPLRRRLAKDVFSAVSGYPLPPAFTDEIKTILRERISCTKFFATYKISFLGKDAVSVDLDVERHFKNHGSITEKLILGVGTEEWFREAGKSAISKYEYQYEGGEIIKATNRVRRRDAGMGTGQIKVKLAPGATIRTWATYREIKARTDVHFLYVAYATENPRVTVYLPPELDKRITFAHPAKAQTGGHAHTVDLPATLMPQQTIIVLWWERDKNMEWRASEKGVDGEPWAAFDASNSSATRMISTASQSLSETPAAIAGETRSV